MKKILSLLFAATLLIGVAACGKTEAQNEPQPVAVSSKSAAKNSKILVVYFSMPETTNPNNMNQEEANSTVVIDGKVLGNTQYVAQVIQEHMGADIYRLEPSNPYPTDHRTLIDQAKSEQNNGARPAIAKQIENIDQYDVIFLGYPNWWGDMPMILYTFLEGTPLAGKMIIPFNTHGGSGFSSTIQSIQRLQPDATVVTNGFTVSRNRVADSKADVISWLERLNLK